MFARNFRAWAREALRNYWGLAIAVALVGSFLCTGVDMVSSSLTLNVNMETMEMEMGTVGESGLLNAIPRQVWAMMITITLVSAIAVLVLGGATQLGMCSFFTKLVDHRQVRFGDLFSHYHRLWTGFCMNFMMGLFVFLWSLLLVIPGIIAGYRYAMIPYLMAEFPDLKLMDAFRESKRLMKGNKARLFYLHLSFFGWNILSMMTMGILGIWLAPYVRAAEAAFYMEVTGRGQARYQGMAQPLNPGQQPFNQGPEF